MNIADPISTLSDLFLGIASSACRDALDSNDDGELDVTDVVYTLEYLYIGGDMPPPPYPDPGYDPSDDDLEICK